MTLNKRDIIALFHTEAIDHWQAQGSRKDRMASVTCWKGVNVRSGECEKNTQDAAASTLSNDIIREIRSRVLCKTVMKKAGSFEWILGFEWIHSANKIFGAVTVLDLYLLTENHAGA